MAKLILATVFVVLVGALAEPPSSYRPPQARNSPSAQYGAPHQQGQGNGFSGRSSGRSFSYNSMAESQFSGSSRNRASTRHQPSQQYGAPNGFDNSIVTDAAARFGQNRQSGSNFGAPRGFAPQTRQQPQSQYNAPSFRQQPASQFNAPSARFQPKSSYSAPARQQPASQYGPPSSEYGVPSSRKMDDDLAEPANYEYNYEVQAAEESGAEFGHQETREDDTARGEYHVLLPDGRIQIVEYEADEEGFRPKIRYEETGYPDARDNQGPY